MTLVTILKVLTIVGLLATTVMLLLGILQLFDTKVDARKNNQIMRWRVILQTITFLIFTSMLVLSKV